MLNPCHTRVAFSRRFTKNAERQGERRENSMDAVATRWELHRTPWEILERQGSAFLLDMLKTNAITRRSNKSAVGTSWQRSENFINAAGTPRAGREIVVQTPW